MDDWFYKTGVTFGCFDLLHPGHTLLLIQMLNECKHVVIGLHVNPALEREEKNKPVQGLYERWLSLDNFLEGRGKTYTIIPYETEQDIITILKTFEIDARYLGDDYEGKFFTGNLYCSEHDIEIVYVPRAHGYSTSNLRNRIKNAK